MCSYGVPARRDRRRAVRVIVDVAAVFSADLGDIRPGEAAEETGVWLELNCSYLVRR